MWFLCGCVEWREVMGRGGTWEKCCGNTRAGFDNGGRGCRLEAGGELFVI